MTGPFEEHPTSRPGLGSRLLGRGARVQATREIETLLATAPTISSVRREQVTRIVEAHELDLRRLEAPCRELYRRYFEHCLVDRALSDDERAELSCLRELLEIDDHAASSIHEEVGFGIYGAAIDEVFEDNRIEADERAFLEGLRADLGLDAEAAARAFEEGRERARRRFLSKAVSSESAFVASQQPALELEGSSSDSLESAILDALEQAETVLPDVGRVEVRQIHVDVEGGRIGEWHVKLRGGVSRTD